jgi:hypothetical protein
MNRWFAALALLLLVPGATAQADTYPPIGIANPTQSSNVTLYFHINGFQEFPINTQRPADWYNENAGVGITTSSSTCAGLTKGTPANKEFHTSYGFSSPGYVEYDFTPDGKPRIHPERGLSYDIQFDGDFNLYWYLSTQTGVPPQPQANPDTAPIVVPNVVVRATIRTGERITVDDSGYNEGAIIAQGQTAPATLALQATTGARWVQVNGVNVYEFVVPMSLKETVIPKDGGYSLRVDTFMDSPACNDPTQGYLMPNLVKIHTSEALRPRMEPKVFVPVRIEYMHPQFIFEDLVVHTSMNSPFGNYDVDETEGGIELRILDAAGNPAAPGLFRAAVVQRFHEHDHHTEAVDVSYVWPFVKDGAKPGVYTVHLKVYNDQRTAAAYGTAKFEIGDTLKVTKCGTTDSISGAQAQESCVDELQNPDGSQATLQAKESPGLQVVAAFLVLAVFAARRR